MTIVTFGHVRRICFAWASKFGTGTMVIQKKNIDLKGEMGGGVVSIVD